jgi:hypothetical protein
MGGKEGWVANYRDGRLSRGMGGKIEGLVAK